MTTAADVDSRHSDLDDQRTLSVSPLRSPAEVRTVHQITDALADPYVRAARPPSTCSTATTTASW